MLSPAESACRLVVVAEPYFQVCFHCLWGRHHEWLHGQHDEPVHDGRETVDVLLPRSSRVAEQHLVIP